MANRSQIQFYLNGEPHHVGGEHSATMLADYLRYVRGLTGTKIVCAEGDCGACSVLRYFPLSAKKGGPEFLPINSCIMTLAQVDGSSLVTVDALADENVGLTPVQNAMKSCHGSQCGFCTPGFVVALTGLVEKKLCARGKPAPIDEREAKNALTGNLCRCTGYQPILEAATSIDLMDCTSVRDRFFSRDQEKSLRAALARPLELEADGVSVFAPTTLKAAAAYLKKHKDARLLAGGTDLGVLQNKRKIRLERFVSLHLVKELYEIKSPSPGRLKVGSRVSLTELREAVKQKIPELARFLDVFASPQIKNVATLAGNLANASPIGDTPPFLLVARAKQVVMGPKGKRVVPIESFFKGYRKTALGPGEFLVSIEFDIPKAQEAFALYKVSQRRDLDISTVNAAFRARMTKGKVEEISVAMGGIAATPLRLSRTEEVLEGAEFSEELLTRAAATLHSEMEPLSDLRGSSAFRRVVAENLLRKFFRERVRS